MVTLIAALVAASTIGQTQEPATTGDPTFATWANAVERHEPGALDDSVDTVLGWRDDQLADLRVAIQKRFAGFPVHVRRVQHTLLRRGALLHMDAAMASVDRPPRRASAPPRQPRPRGHAPASPSLSVRADDGRYDGLERPAGHWEFGRTLLRVLEPEPSGDPFVRLWYVAASAYMANRSQFADLSVHLERAERILPDDPDVMFASGCQYEVFGSPRIQPVRDATLLPAGFRLAVPAARESNQRAVRYFRRAVELRSDFGDAHVRLARVLAMTGRDDEAAVALRHAATLPLSLEMRYYVQLFEAAGHEQAGRATAAREAYERALTLFPNAQAPLVAMSRLANADGDRQESVRLLNLAFTRRAHDERDDPWFTYHLWLVRDGEDTLGRLRRQPLTEPTR